MIESGEFLTQMLRANLANRKQNANIDLFGETEKLLNSVGASTAESGGRLSFYGKDPILPTLVPFASMAAIALACKAVQVASIWPQRACPGQYIHVDARKARGRYGGSYEFKWKLLTGMTEQLLMSATPGSFTHIVEPRGSSQPEWLER